MNGGVITGGWDFIWAAYGLAWGGIALYGLSLWWRRPRGTSAAAPEGRAL